MSKRICIWGDSITEGYYDSRGGWADRLKRYLWSDPKNCSGFSNLGISGDNTDDLVSRTPIEYRHRKPEIIIFAIGINDSLHIENKKDQNIPLRKFEENLRRLVNIVKQSSNIVFVGLTQVVESKVQPIPWSTTKSYHNKTIKKYNKILKSFCQKEQIPFIEMFDLLEDEDLPDGLHPNAEGHKKMFLRIKDFLLKERIIE